MDRIISDKMPDLIALCKQHAIKSLHLFGSAAMGELTSKSDLDFLVSFSDDLSIEEYTENYFLFHEALHNLFNRKIDLVTHNSLSNPYFINEVEQTKQLIYAA